MQQEPTYTYRELLRALALRRKELGLTQMQVAEQLRVVHSQVSRWEKGMTRIPSDKLLELASLYGLEITQGVDGLLRTPSATDPKPLPEGNAVPVPFEGASLERMREDLPIYGTALGGDLMIDGDAIEQTTLNYGEVIAYAKRPVILNGNAKAYGLYVQGSSMEPAHCDGELILAERDKPLRAGDDVVVYLRSNGDDHLSDDGNRARRVLVKRLVRRTGSYIELRQFYPDHTFRVAAADVVNIDRVLRLSDLL